MTAETTTVAPSPNADLFVAVLAQIENHPETWDQGAYRCDSRMCFAGWATQLSGVPWAASHDPLNSFVIFDEQPETCWWVARTLLGIDSAAAGRLFSGGNTLHDLYLESADLLRITVPELRDKVAAVIADGAVQS